MTKHEEYNLIEFDVEAKAKNGIRHHVEYNTSVNRQAVKPWIQTRKLR